MDKCGDQIYFCLLIGHGIPLTLTIYVAPSKIAAVGVMCNLFSYDLPDDERMRNVLSHDRC